MKSDPKADKSKAGKLPAAIWLLGFVSLLMDISSELVHSLLPLFMSTVLGASMLTIGVVEGLAEGTAAFTKLFSGALSDYAGKRKALALGGYAMSAITKPFFPLAGSISLVFVARFFDRIGKGIRGAPRDALVADIAPAHLRGAAFGLRQSLDSVGAFVGPFLAVVLMLLLANNIKLVLWLAVIPAFLSVLLLAIAVKEPEKKINPDGKKNSWSLQQARLLPLRFWLVVLLGAVFTLARFSEAFLILRAQELGLVASLAPAIMIVMNIVYAALAYPAGAAADRHAARKILIAGLLVLVAADITLALAKSGLLAMTGAALWGVHMALTQGLLSKMVADTASENLRGTAFGFFHLVSGLALFLASVIAGFLWSNYGASATFFAGSLFAGLAILGLVIYRPVSATGP